MLLSTLKLLNLECFPRNFNLSIHLVELFFEKSLCSFLLELLGSLHLHNFNLAIFSWLGHNINSHDYAIFSYIGSGFHSIFGNISASFHSIFGNVSSCFDGIFSGFFSYDRSNTKDTSNDTATATFPDFFCSLISLFRSFISLFCSSISLFDLLPCSCLLSFNSNDGHSS